MTRLEKTCNKCNNLIFWDRDNKTMKQTGSWVGDLDKQVHTQQRCQELQKQNKPMEPTKPFEFIITKPEEREIIELNASYLLEARKVIEDVCKGTPYENNQAAIGQFLNLVVAKMENLKKQSDSESD